MNADAAWILSIVSLVIAITAFVLSVFQTSQQFAATADGFARCSSAIIGDWAKHTFRWFRASEVSFKVYFKTPILFIGKPTNQLGPLTEDGVRVKYILGDAESREDTHCRLPPLNKKPTSLPPSKPAVAEKLADTASTKFRGVHTANDETATWYQLLKMLHKAEEDGRTWNYNHTNLTPPRDKFVGFRDAESTLVVQMQEKQRVWDQMPDSVQKPFATSTISHIVEMAVMLGMRWKTFDQDDWNLRAEGNGMMLLSETVWGLGISVSFIVTGKAVFESQRIIPCLAVQRLSFGTVPTILGKFELKFEPSSTKEDALFDIEQTLRALQCDRSTVNKFSSQRRHHIRSVVFDIVAMISQVFRLPNSNFSRIPNPTPDPFGTKLSAVKMMNAFLFHYEATTNSDTSSHGEAGRVAEIWEQHIGAHRWNEEWRSADRPGGMSFALREDLNKAINACDEWILKQPSLIVMTVVGAHLTVVLDDVNDPGEVLSSEECDTEFLLFKAYFECVLPKIFNFEQYQRDKKANEFKQKFEGLRGRTSSDNQGQSLVEATNIPSKFQERQDFMRAHQEKRAVSMTGDERRETWIMLLFRMSCWLLLHDFHEADTLKIPPSLLGSRLPVYIL